MKKVLLKILPLAIIAVLMLTVTACTYTANGSVIRDVEAEFGYEKDGKAKTASGKLSLYKTFAPKTYDRVLKLFKDGFYNDSAVTFDKNGTYAIIGAFDYKDGYTDKSYDKTVEGEFESNGFKGKLSLKAGALVMLREPDTGKGTTGKYDTAKATFAICLTDSPEGITAKNYTVFGMADEDLLKGLKTAKTDCYADADGYTECLYKGDRNESDVLTSDNRTGFYLKSGTYYKIVDGKLAEMDTDGDDKALYDKLKDAPYMDIVALPTTAIKLNSCKVK